MKMGFLGTKLKICEGFFWEWGFLKAWWVLLCLQKLGYTLHIVCLKPVGKEKNATHLCDIFIFYC